MDYYIFSLFILFLQYFKYFTPLKHVKTNNMAFINYIYINTYLRVLLCILPYLIVYLSIFTVFDVK